MGGMGGDATLGDVGRRWATLGGGMGDAGGAALGGMGRVRREAR